MGEWRVESVNALSLSLLSTLYSPLSPTAASNIKQYALLDLECQQSVCGHILYEPELPLPNCELTFVNVVLAFVPTA